MILYLVEKYFEVLIDVLVNNNYKQILKYYIFLLK